jgi:hypothetical protein
MIAFKGFDDWIPIFRGGRQIDGNGRAWDGDGLIDKALASFDVGTHEPPVVVGHPRHDAPAFGWVEGLKKEGDLLMAKFRDVVPEFTEAVKKGLYKKRSAAFYPDGRLRHVGFLGATPPAVKGLADVAFAEGEAASFEFSEEVSRPIEALDAEHKNQPDKEANMKFKEWFKGVMEKVMAEIPDDGPPVPAAGTFSEADLERAKKEAADEAARKERERVTAEFAEKERRGLRDRRRAEISSWCEGMVSQGRLTPALVQFGVPEMLAAFAEKEEAIEFGEAKQKATLHDRFKALFETELPKLLEFGEIATRDRDIGDDGNREKLIAVFMEKNKEKTYKEAVLAVSKEHPDLFRRQ